MDKLLETAEDEANNSRGHAKGYWETTGTSCFHMLLSVISLPSLKVGIVPVF